MPKSGSRTQVKLFSSILLVVITTVSSQNEHLLNCVEDNQGNIDVTYNGTLHFETFHTNSTDLAANQTLQNVTVCVYNNDTAISLNTTYNVSCVKHRDGNVSTFSVRNSLFSNRDVCFNSELEKEHRNRSRQGFLFVTDSPTLATFDPRRPMATLAVIDRDGYIVNSVTSTEELRLRVQTLTDEEYFPPIIGQCWYRLWSGEQNNRTLVKPSVMFVEYGCSVQDENQLILTNQDLFYINGLMEKVSYPFDLSKFYETPFDFMQITCEVYYCTEAQSCRARCPPSQTTYQVSGHPKRLNITTEIYVVFVRPTTQEQTTKSGILLGSLGTTEKQSDKKSTLDEYQPYFLIGTLILTALSLCVIVGFLAKFVCRQRNAEESDDNEHDHDVVFHKNIHSEEQGVIPTKDNHHLLDQNHNIDKRNELSYHGNHKIQESGFHSNTRVPELGNKDLRHESRYNGDQRFASNLHPDSKNGNGNHGNQNYHNGYEQNDRFEQQNPRLRSAYNNQLLHFQYIDQLDNQQARLPNRFHDNSNHGNWIPRPHANRQSQDNQVSMSQAKSNSRGNLVVVSPPPAYISKTNLRSTPRTQADVNPYQVTTKEELSN